MNLSASPLPSSDTLRTKVRDALNDVTVSPHVCISELVENFRDMLRTQIESGSLVNTHRTTIRYGVGDHSPFMDYIVVFTIINPAGHGMLGISTCSRGIRGSGTYFPLEEASGLQVMATISQLLSWFHRETPALRKLLALKERATLLDSSNMTKYVWYVSERGV